MSNQSSNNNKRSANTYEKNGGKQLIGKQLMDCHPERAKKIIRELMNEGKTNAYTIEKEGLKKLIYQSPWYENGEFAAIRRTLSDEQAQKGHDLSRAAFDKCVVREAKAHGLVPFYWDRGDGVLNRKSLTIYDELEYNGLMEGLK